MTQQGELSNRKLYVYGLAPEILATIQLKDSSFPEAAAIYRDVPSKSGVGNVDAVDIEEESSGSAASTSCAMCGVTLPDVREYRGHVKSDFHGYNLKQKIRGFKTVSETEFEKLVGDLNESLSGSDSSSSSTEGEDENKVKETTLTTLLKKQASISTPATGPAVKRPKQGAGKAPLIWFTSSALPENTYLGIYRALFTDIEQSDNSHIVSSLKAKQLSSSAPRLPADPDTGIPIAVPENTGPHIFLCMIGGGHFAGMIVSLTPKITKKNHPPGDSERQATVLAHKTFHRYTTRRKQGGAQSSNDAAKGAAHSAGSSLRRYNETALTAEIRALLAEWKGLIDTADLLFVRATGSTNRRTLFGPYDGQVLRHNDPRVRGFPFSTRRATQAELMRSFVELTRVKASTIDEEALAAAAAVEQDRAGKGIERVPAPKPPKSKRSKEEETTIMHTLQIQALIRRSRASALVTYLEKHNLGPGFIFGPKEEKQNHHSPTPLHLAASSNASAVVTALLTKASANPTALSEDGKTPFELAGDRTTRDAFRVCRGRLGEGQWDWDAARVPAAISQAEVARRAAAEKREEERTEQERRRLEMERLKREELEAPWKGKTGGKTVGAGLAEKTAAEKREEEAQGLSPEMRMRLERERRARAAEERMKRA